MQTQLTHTRIAYNDDPLTGPGFLLVRQYEWPTSKRVVESVMPYRGELDVALMIATQMANEPETVGGVVEVFETRDVALENRYVHPDAVDPERWKIGEVTR